MDRQTQEWLQELKRLRKVNWKLDEEVMGVGVHQLIDVLEGLCRSMPGKRALSKEAETRIRSRLETRREARRCREWIDQYVAAFGYFNDSLLTVTDGILISLGYRRYSREDWHLTDIAVLERFRKKVDPMNQAKAQPLLVHTPPTNEAETINLFSRARNGDADALMRVHQLIRDRNWTSWLGDLGHEATLQLLARVAEGDPVWQVGIMEQVKELLNELLGDDPSVVERLLVRRVVNGWIVLHGLELQQAVRPPEAMDRQRHLDQAISRAQRRYVDALRELTRVRRLQAPKELKKLVGEGEVCELIPMKK